MGKINNWFKKQAAALAVATSKVEKNALGQEGKQAEDLDAAGVVNPTEQQSLMEALRQGVVNEEVRQLRWRMYKIERAADRYEMVKKRNQELGYEAYSTENIQQLLNEGKKKISLDPSDRGELDLLFINKAMGDKWDWTDYDEGRQMTQEEIIKEEKPLMVERDFNPSFFIENFVDSVYVRDAGGNRKLIELFVNKNGDPNNRLQHMFLTHLQKAIREKRIKDFLQIDKVGFITNRSSVGVEPSMAYSYNIDSFYKITEFGNYYVIKYHGSVENNGFDIFEQYRHEELDKKYENKERKNNTIENPNMFNPDSSDGKQIL